MVVHAWALLLRGLWASISRKRGLAFRCVYADQFSYIDPFDSSR